MRSLAALLAALALLLSGCGGASTAQDAAGASPSAARPLDFTSTTVAGADFDARSLAGRPVVLWFWAPWCPTCLAQVPLVDELAATYGEQVAFVGVGSLDSQAEIADFAADVSPQVTQLDDGDGEVWRHFGVSTQSSFVVLDAEGERVGAGGLDDDELTDLVAGLAS